MAGPTFPKFRGKFSGIGGQAANVQVPGLPYQKMQRRDAAGNVVKTKVSGDFIDVRVGESRNEYITLNASPLMKLLVPSVILGLGTGALLHTVDEGGPM